MATDLFKHVLLSDGEGLTHGDLNLMQQAPLARLLDQMVMPQFGDVAKDPFIAVNQTDNTYDLDQLNIPYARTMTSGDAVLMAGSGGDLGKVKVGPGTILQKTLVASTGLVPTVLTYTVPAAGTSFLTPAAGHATEHRFDILQVALSQTSDSSENRDFEDAITGAKSSSATNKATRTQATFSLKQGTGNTTISSLVIPSPDAGYATLGVIFIPATWTTASSFRVDGQYPIAGAANAALYQGSIPLGMRSHTVYAHQFSLAAVTNWAISVDTAQASAAATNLRIYCPAAMSRLLGVSIQGFTTAPWNVTGSLQDTIHSGTTSNTFTTWFTGVDLTAAAGAAHSKYTSVYNLGLKLPLWGQSAGAGPIERRAGSAAGTTPLRGLVLTLAASGINCRVSSVTFHTAG